MTLAPKIPEKQYHEICCLHPIACVDLYVENEAGHVLLLRRKHEPARAEWWFPGGRVLYRETRVDAVVRKLKEETGLVPVRVTELGTFDWMFEDGPEPAARHGITTLFRVTVQETEVHLDEQSEESRWRSPKEWRRKKLHPFVDARFEAAMENE